MKDAPAVKRLLLPLKEAADMLSMTRQSVMSHVQKGELTCVRLAKNSVWFREVDLIDFVDAHLERRKPLNLAA